MGLPEGLVSPFQIAHPQPNLTDLVVSLAGKGRYRPLQLAARAPRFNLRVGPCAAQSHELRAVDAADTWESGDRFSLAPASGSLRPLASDCEFAGLAIGGDRVAVQDACRPRAELTAHRRGTSFVEVRKRFAGASHRSQAGSKPAHAHR